MIELKFDRVYIDQLDEWIQHIQEQWKKIRGRINWGVGLNFISTTTRQMLDHHLVATEWKFSRTRGIPKTMIVFVFDTIENSCEVFGAVGDGNPQNDKKIARTIEEAYNCLSISSRIHDF